MLMIFIQGGTAIILDICKGGAFAKDGRLKPGDQILDCNGVAIAKEMAHERRCLTIKQKTAKVELSRYNVKKLIILYSRLESV